MNNYVVTTFSYFTNSINFVFTMILCLLDYHIGNNKKKIYNISSKVCIYIFGNILRIYTNICAC